MSNKKQQKTIDQKRQELAELLAWFESDDFSIEQAIERFTEAEALAKDIEAELMQQKNTIIELKQRFDQE